MRMSKSNYPVKIEAVCEVDSKYAIGISADANGVFRFNLDSGTGTYISMVPNEGIRKKRLYTTACNKGGLIYFTPFTANDIAVLDTDNYSIFKKEIKNPSGYSEGRKFSGVVEYGNYLFMTPCTYPAVLRINTLTGEMDYYDNWVDGQKFIFRKSPEVVGSHFYVPSVSSDLLLDFDMERCEGYLHHLGVGRGYWSSCFVDDYLWLAPIHQDPIIRWDIHKHTIDKLTEYPKGFEGRDFLFTKIYLNNEGLFAIPARANMCLRIDINKMELNRAPIDEITGNRVTEFLAQMKGCLYLATKSDEGDKYIKLKMEDNTIEPFAFHINDDERKRYCVDFVTDMAEYSEIIRENSLINLGGFLESLTK